MVEDDPETADVDETSDGKCEFADGLIVSTGAEADTLASRGCRRCRRRLPLLSFNREPVGPARIMCEPGCLARVRPDVLAAYEGYYDGAPATARS